MTFGVSRDAACWSGLGLACAACFARVNASSTPGCGACCSISRASILAPCACLAKMATLPSRSTCGERDIRDSSETTTCWSVHVPILFFGSFRVCFYSLWRLRYGTPHQMYAPPTPLLRTLFASCTTTTSCESLESLHGSLSRVAGEEFSHGHLLILIIFAVRSMSTRYFPSCQPSKCTSQRRYMLSHRATASRYL